jgi:dTDP-4-amino-4,6-dideoxygalactose transaminase
VIEDAAQGVNATYKGKFLGTLGHLGCYSFHETKNFISGEGGALVVNDNDFIDRAEIIREKGTNRSQFLNGKTDKYTWIDIGSSYLPSDIIAAFLYAQLEEADTITAKRKQIFQTYYKGLRSLADSGQIRLPHTPSNIDGNAHMFYCIMDSHAERTKLIDFLKSKNITAFFHYVPLHSSPAGKRYGSNRESLQITESIASRVLRLPCYYEMTKQDCENVIAKIEEFFDF